MSTSILLWSRKARLKGFTPLSERTATSIAREMMAAINGELKGARTSAKVWLAYVDLYDSMTQFQSAAKSVAGLDPRFRYLSVDLEPMRGALASLLRPLDVRGNERARFHSAGREYVFGGVQRGRSISLQAKVTRAAALVWRVHCNSYPPVRKGSHFDEALEAACEYFEVYAPGRVALAQAITEFKRELQSHEPVVTLRFNANI